jgi:hypothetical protein
VTADTEVGMATPVTAAGELVAAAELPPPQAHNSKARADNEAQKMVFTRKPPDARQMARRPAAAQQAKRRSVSAPATPLPRPTTQLSTQAILVLRELTD